MKCSKLLSKPSTDFWGSVKCTKFVMDEMYEIGQVFAVFEYEYCRICVASSCKSTNFVLLVKSTLISFFWLFGLCVCVLLLGMYESSYSIIGLYTLLLRYERDIRNFALSPLCLLYMKFLMPLAKKLGCKRCIGSKW